jgi:hypothetical protein
MHEKSRELAKQFVAKQIGRRELMQGMGKLGVAAATANFLVSEASTRALAADFDWQKHKGKTVTLLVNKHPYLDAMVANLPAFKQLTGMEVKYDVFPEDVYFDKVTAALSSRSTQYDAFMTGAYQTWKYGPAGWLVDLNEFIKSPATAPNYNWDDILPNLRASTAWSGVPGRRSATARRSSGRSRGASSSTTSPTTAGCSTRPASSRPRTCPSWSRPRASSPRPAAPTASACAARAPGPRSIPATSRPSPTTARRTSRCRAAS